MTQARTLGALLAASLLVAAPLRAQRLVAGGGVALADYREQGPSLRFHGSGPSGAVDFRWRRFALGVAGAHLAFDPTSGDAAEPFTMSQVDVRLRARAVRNVSLEAGFVRRAVTPDHAAQSMGAVRLGAQAAFPLAVGADVSLRSGYLAGATFSGGGSAPFGVEVGMRVSYGPGSGRVRAIADFEFQRLDRRTTVDGLSRSVPIQSTVVRVGAGLAY
jgi:hypothetical protein